jgi:electron transfer flavoprotein beta subunit
MSALRQFVLVKQVADPEALVRVRSDLELEVEAKGVTSFFDEIAVEQALRLKEQHGGTVVAVTVGAGRRASDAARRALAMGADEAIQVEDPALDEADGLGVARAIAATIRASGGADLVLCGRVSGDVEAGLVGPAVAEALGIPHVMSVVELRVDAGRLRVGRQVERGVEVLDLPLPAVIGAQKGLCEPRVPKVMHVMKAAKAKVVTRDLASLGLEPGDVAPASELVRYEPPRRRGPVVMAAGEFPANVDDLVRLLRDQARVV